MQPGRNYRCPCGSGRKFKKCCGTAPAEADLPREAGAATEAAHAPDLRALTALVNARRFAELEHQMRDFLARQPRCGLAWKALSVALRMQNKDALQAMEQATDLLPGDAEAHANLGSARLALGDLAGAFTSYAAALALEPGNAVAHLNLGTVLRLLGKLDEAEASFAEACALRPDFAEAHAARGNLLRAQGRSDAALREYARALELNADDAGTQNNLANALLDQGEVDAAATHYRRALELKPDSAEAHNNLGNALRRQGRLGEAAASYRQALILNPTFAGAHSNLSDVQRELGQPAAAVDSSCRAIALEPNLVSAHNSLGNAWLDLGRFAEAAASYRQALALDPAFVEGHINLGLVARQQGLASAAEASCLAALEANPRAAAAHVLLAELKADRGLFADAEASFERALAIDAELPEAWAGIAHCRRMTVDDAAWAARAQRIADGRLLPRQEAHLRFAIGKYFDDIGDYDQAFRNFHRANELGKSYAVPYDAGLRTREVDGIIDAYPAGKAHAGIGSPDRPVFIVGMPRSGTTLAEQMLASHPGVFGAGELTFWQEVRPGPSSAGDYLRLIDSLAPCASRVIDKMPANFAALGLIHEALPSARIIHMRRNPIDTCLSIYFQHFRTGHAYAHDLGDIAHYYWEYSRLMQHWRITLPEGAILDVPYEELVDDPETWSRKMLAFIDLPWDSACLNFQRTPRRVMTASKWQVRQAINRSSVERWRHYAGFVSPLKHLA